MGKRVTINGNSVLIALVFLGSGSRGEFCELRLRMGEVMLKIRKDCYTIFK